MPATYPRPLLLIPRIAAASLAGRTRSFHRDAQLAVSRLQPPLEVRGQDAIPASGPYLLTCNHFSAPGLGAWWITLALSSVLPHEVHWIMTGAMIFPGKAYEAAMRILTTWAFRRVAQVYGFTNMTPVPPYSNDVQGRARDVRQVLAYARRTPNPVIGLAPEGTDHKGGVLGAPPAGAGRFIAHLAPACRVILPAGVFDAGDHLCAQFGSPYTLDVPKGLTPEQLDQQVSQTVMHAIALQLPERLRGDYG